MTRAAANEIAVTQAAGGGVETLARRRRVEAPEIRRRQIIEAAKTRYRMTGFHAARMADIAAEAGVSVGLIYQHFPSKEALIEGIMLEDVEDQMQVIRTALEACEGDVRKLIRRGWKGFAPLLLNRDRTLLMIEVAAETARNPKLREMMERAESDVDGRVQAAIAALTPPGWSQEKMSARLQVLNGLLQAMGLRFAVRGLPPTSEMLKAVLKTSRALFEA